MALSYIHCPSCGQKALPVATQCPRCGKPFETALSPRPAPPSGPNRVRAGLFIAGAAAVAIVANALRDRPTITPGGLSPGSATAPGDTAAALPAEQAGAPRPRPAEPEPATSEERHPAAAPAPPATGAASRPDPARVRYATTWVNVRAAPTPAAPVVHVLRPGDTVTVDSLARGWYRAESEGQVLGYVFRGYVDTAPPEVP